MGRIKRSIFKMVLSAVLLALALVLPLLTGQIRSVGNSLLPMHIPVILCGYLCGPWYGLLVGFIAPYLRFAVFGMPPIIPAAVAMSFELATYAVSAALFDRLLPAKKPFLYLSLLFSMLSGRVVWGVARTVLYGVFSSEFSLALFISGGFTSAVPGMILQIVLVPLLVMTVRRLFPAAFERGKI